MDINDYINKSCKALEDSYFKPEKAKKQAIEAIENGDISVKEIIEACTVSEILDGIDFDELNEYVKTNWPYDD